MKSALKSHFGCLFSLVMLGGCLSQSADPQKIINAAIDAHGGDSFDKTRITFTFRDRQYERERDGGYFVFRRIFTDSTGRTVADMLTNDDFIREVEGQQVALSYEDRQKYTASVNSVIYFALLPYRLNDAAVQKRYLGRAEIKGEPYHKVEITFMESGGGEDFSDVFVYWVHQEKATMDYLAYSYAEEDGMGVRFREAYNARRVGGILFQDYINYKGPGELYPGKLDSLFALNQLDLLSRIDLEEMAVEKIEKIEPRREVIF
jgi:hypothetical protein